MNEKELLKKLAKYKNTVLVIQNEEELSYFVNNLIIEEFRYIGDSFKEEIPFGLYLNEGTWDTFKVISKNKDLEMYSIEEFKKLNRTINKLYKLKEDSYCYIDITGYTMSCNKILDIAGIKIKVAELNKIISLYHECLLHSSVTPTIKWEDIITEEPVLIRPLLSKCKIIDERHLILPEGNWKLENNILTCYD